MPRLLFKRYSIHEDSGLQSGQRQHLFATRQNQSFAGPGATNQSINQHPAHGSASHHFISVIKEAAREIHEVVLKYRITPNLYACGQAAPQKLACRFGVKSLVLLYTKHFEAAIGLDLLVSRRLSSYSSPPPVLSAPASD